MTSSTAEQLCRRFSLAEILSATDDFGEARVIGIGGFGKVYKGFIDIDEGSVIVAIKRRESNSKQGEREFATEMETLTKVRHRNIVSLIGYCNEEEEMILVYEFVANRTLADHLYKLNDGGDSSSLTWNERLNICIGAGRGLDYLHSGCEIIHRDVKSTNILLDENFRAKVSDFGLAKHFSTDNLESHVSASLKGTFGYIDPSYFTTGRLTKASDSYAFGVVLLEVLSGKPAVGRASEHEPWMTIWAQDKIRNGKIEQIVASNLKGEISEGCLKTFVGVVERCLDQKPKRRMTMTRVVAQLELALEQQERKGAITRRLQFRSFWNGVIPYGSTQKDQNEVEVDKQPQVIPAIEEEEEALENKMQTIVVPSIQVHHNVDVPRPIFAFQLAEIKDITDDFSSKCLIAKGSGGGSVFRGVLKTGQHAAIKKPYKKSQNREFIAEVSAISRLKHDNVVQLLGCCLDGGLLVYEFAPRGSLRLHDILHEAEPDPAFSWAQRIKTAVEAAKGLLYIHEKELIHRNIKSSNVLVFDDEIAKITDLHTSTRCTCKASYRDERYPRDSSNYLLDYHHPECGHISETHDDVYSFGVVLLELLTGRELFECPRWQQNQLLSMVQQQLGSDKNVDARLKAEYPPKAVEMVIELVQSCIRDEANLRPDMSNVLQALQIASQERQEY